MPRPKYFPRKKILTKNVFKIQREQNGIETIIEILNNSDFYVPVCIDNHFHEKRAYRYTFYERLKEQRVKRKYIFYMA